MFLNTAVYDFYNTENTDSIGKDSRCIQVDTGKLHPSSKTGSDTA